MTSCTVLLFTLIFKPSRDRLNDVIFGIKGPRKIIFWNINLQTELINNFKETFVLVKEMGWNIKTFKAMGWVYGVLTCKEIKTLQPLSIASKDDIGDSERIWQPLNCVVIKFYCIVRIAEPSRVTPMFWWFVSYVTHESDSMIFSPNCMVWCL